MSLADARNATLRRKGGVPCPIASFFEWSREHEPDNEENFAQLVADGASHTGLSRLIKEYTGYEKAVPGASIGKHLRGDCRCVSE